MYVIIAGVGEVGRRVADELSQRGHDVIAIDKNKTVCDRVSTRTGAKVFHGDASSYNVLKKAGIEKADVCIGLIGRDSANLAFVILSSSFGVPNILARMRNPSYEEAYDRAGASQTLNTVEIYMDSLLMEIEHPSLKKVADLGAGEASIVIVEIPEDSPMRDKRVAEIMMDEEFPNNCVFAGIYRGEDFITPKGNEKIMAKDRIFLSGDSESIREAAEHLGVR
ncbi:MAG: potassium channel family protein [Candidatus Hadarchaeota archaeon]